MSKAGIFDKSEQGMIGFEPEARLKTFLASLRLLGSSALSQSILESVTFLMADSWVSMNSFGLL